MEYKNCSLAYWGEPDIELTFCENKYENKYIAEYYNSMSAISYMIVGIILYTSYRDNTRENKISKENQKRNYIMSN